MRRIIIIFVVLILAILSDVFLYFYSSRWEPFRCNTHIKSHINIKDGQKLELNLDINAIAVHEGSSELLLVGSLKGLNQDYVISRRVFLSIKQSDFNAFTNTMISREKRHPIDNVPDDVWQKYVLPETPGVAFYTQTKQLDKNAFLIKGLTNPFFVCTRTEH
ncbi:TPA: hypothetical protein SMF49_004191 [Serratia marcescens]|nr:hypothetical protein [Serratia marcescens]